jgi:hypothetical protein
MMSSVTLGAQPVTRSRCCRKDLRVVAAGFAAEDQLLGFSEIVFLDEDDDLFFRCASPPIRSFSSLECVAVKRH